MALTITLIVSLIAVANAGYIWVNNNDNTFNPFQPIKMPRMPTPPTPPTPPRSPFAFANFAGFPGFPGFQMPQIRLPHIPTPEEMANVKPGPNQVYHGVAVKSSSSYTTDKDGNPIRTGGTSFIVNDNGNVIKHQSGDTPPDLNEPIVLIYENQTLQYGLHKKQPQMPQMPTMPTLPTMPTMPTMPKLPLFKPFVMAPILPIVPVKPIIIDPIDIENHIPGDDEHFVGSSTSSFSHTEIVDGVETSGGGSSILVNNNGDVKKESVVFGQGDKE